MPTFHLEALFLRVHSCHSIVYLAMKMPEDGRLNLVCGLRLSVRTEAVTCASNSCVTHKFNPTKMKHFNFRTWYPCVLLARYVCA